MRWNKYQKAFIDYKHVKMKSWKGKRTMVVGARDQG
jgi:hypothetical protein